MPTLTFLELAKRVLEEERKPLSADEIWSVAKTKGYDHLVGSEGKTPRATLAARLYVNVRDRKDSPFSKIGTRPKRFVLRGQLNEGESRELEAERAVVTLAVERPEYLEKDLHPILAYYAKFFLRAYTKTIQHSRSEKKEFGEWIHPDMVGCYFPVEDWKPEVVEFGSAVGSVAIKLFSFELKKELTFANLRESFFQTVSNSSWANEGYLVASEISGDEDFRSELRRLSTSFGIGVIQLNLKDPDTSEIMFPGRVRENLDWDAINKLTMNSDFREFLRRVRIDISSKEIRKEKYDRILDRDELIKAICR